MFYLASVAISFLVIYTVIYILLKKRGNERSIFSSFSFFFILYLSILPFVNLVFAVLFVILPLTGADEEI